LTIIRYGGIIIQNIGGNFMSKKRTIIQTMITLLVAGATLVGSAIVIGDNGKFIDWKKIHHIYSYTFQAFEDCLKHH